MGKYDILTAQHIVGDELPLPETSLYQAVDGAFFLATEAVDGAITTLPLSHAEAYAWASLYLANDADTLMFYFDKETTV